MRYKLCIPLLLIIFSCSREDKSDITTIIDIESNVNNWKVANLSSFVESIRYVPLETTENIILRGLGFQKISDDLILIRDSENCLLYDSKGTFINKIGNKGRGPGEYSVISDMGIGSCRKPKIYISQNVDILEYNIDGNYIGKYKNSLLVNDTSAVLRWEIIHDSLFFGHVNNNTGKVELKAVIKDKHGNILHSFKNYDRLDGRPSALEKEVSIYKFKELIYYKELNNDTLFYLNDNNELVAEYVFKLGEFKVPNSERIKRPHGPVFFNYLFVWYAFQTESYLFINCQFGNRFPAKRLTAKSLGPSPTTTMYNTTYTLGIYNKSVKKLFFCEPTNTDNPLFTTGIYNDFDAGPRFFPQAQINDSTMVMWVTSFDLKMHVQSNDFKNNIPKYPEKKKLLQEIADSLTYFDNPVMMYVTFK
jgi:hypothetical protein